MRHLNEMMTKLLFKCSKSRGLAMRNTKLVSASYTLSECVNLELLEFRKLDCMYEYVCLCEDNAHIFDVTHCVQSVSDVMND